MDTNKLLQIIGLMLMAIFSAMPAHAKPKVVVKHKSYKVRGQNIAEIEQSIHANGIPAGNGTTFAADTDYALSWQFTVNEGNNSCSIASANTEVVITYTMPELDNNKDKTTQSQWDSYHTSLETHEAGHAAISIHAAEEIEWAIANTLPPMQNCAQLAQAANALGTDIANKYHNDNIKYDIDTDHGHNQGAFFLAANN
jgi:predicted secreted Zn-dependent protease